MAAQLIAAILVIIIIIIIIAVVLMFLTKKWSFSKEGVTTTKPLEQFKGQTTEGVELEAQEVFLNGKLIGVVEHTPSGWHGQALNGKWTPFFPTKQEAIDVLVKTATVV